LAKIRPSLRRTNPSVKLFLALHLCGVYDACNMTTNKRTLKTAYLHPLKWPDGWERTRIQDRKKQSAWHKRLTEYRDSLYRELLRMGATEVLLSYNDMIDDARRDCGVAVYFSRTKADQFSWQDTLGIDNPAPTVEEINKAFREKAMPHHPDRIAQTGKGDPAIFDKMSKARDAAIAWIRGTHTAEHEYVIATDQFDEVRLNVQSLKLIVAALRQLERLGDPRVLERTFRGFRTALPANASSSEVANEPVSA
jgi:hypothetical protein